MSGGTNINISNEEDMQDHNNTNYGHDNTELHDDEAVATMEPAEPEAASDDAIDPLDVDAELNGILDREIERLHGREAGSADAATLRDSLARIVAQERKVTAYHADYVAAKEAAKNAKERWEAASHELAEIIRDESEPNLFSSDPPTAAATPAAAPGIDEDDAWRSVRLDTLDLPPGIIKALAKHNPPILTIGDHADYLKPTDSGFERRLTDIKGIGKGSVDRIDNALDVFWAEYRSRPIRTAVDAGESQQSKE